MQTVTLYKLYFTFFLLLLFSGCATSMKMVSAELQNLEPNEGIVIGSIMIKEGKDLLSRNKWELGASNIKTGSSLLFDYSIEAKSGEDEVVFAAKMPAGDYRFWQLRQTGFSAFHLQTDIGFKVQPNKTVYLGRLKIEFAPSLIYVGTEVKFEVEDVKKSTLVRANKKYGLLLRDVITNLMTIAPTQTSPGKYKKQLQTKKTIASTLAKIAYKKQLQVVTDIIAKNYIEEVKPKDIILNAVKGMEELVAKRGFELSKLELDWENKVSTDDCLRLYADAFTFFKANTKLLPQELEYAAIRGMVGSLDPRSKFYTREEYEELVIDKDEKHCGIGVSITMKNDFVTVVTPNYGTPAYKAGIKCGDKIIKIDSESTNTIRQAVKLIRGPKGKEIAVIVSREGVAKPIEFKMVRDKITIESVKSIVLKPGYGYIWITNFRYDTTEDLVAELDKLESEDVPLKGLILDLRDNQGGLLNQSIQISDLFLEKGTIVIIKGRQKNDAKIYEAMPSSTKRSYPIVVLINGVSAGASEIVAGALQDNKRAIILGTTSLGLGFIQNVETLRDGSILKLTIARYYTPNGRPIQNVGIKPDIFIDHETECNRYNPLKIEELMSSKLIQQALVVLKK